MAILKFDHILLYVDSTTEIHYKIKEDGCIQCDLTLFLLDTYQEQIQIFILRKLIFILRQPHCIKYDQFAYLLIIKDGIVK